MSWINVKDRMPDNQFLVTVRDNFSGEVKTECASFRGGEWHIDDGAVNDLGKEVTHWQPLPDPYKARTESKNTLPQGVDLPSPEVKAKDRKGVLPFIQRYCKTCGKEIKKGPTVSHERYQKTKFCSRACISFDGSKKRRI